MDFHEYQRKAEETVAYPPERALEYLALGLASEAGEVASEIKKMLRDDQGVMTEGRRAAVLAEAGDVLWYVAVLCTELQAALDTVAIANTRKLADRKLRGVLRGNGSRR